jgi:hypothetical protein
MPTVTPSPLDPFIPIIITLLKQTGFDSKWNAWIAIGVYAIWTVISLATDHSGGRIQRLHDRGRDRLRLLPARPQEPARRRRGAA